MPTYPEINTHRKSWARLHTLWEETAKRQAISSNVSNGILWPGGNALWYIGTCTAATETTIEDTTQTVGHNWGHTFFNYVNLNAPWDPRFYDLVLFTCDVTKTVHTRIIAAESGDVSTGNPPADPDAPWNPVGTIQNVANMRDFVTSGVLGSIGGLAGFHYAILKRDGLFPYERHPAWPNDSYKAICSVTSATEEGLVKVQLFNYGDFGIGSSNRPAVWDRDQWAGYEAMVYDSDGFLHRATIEGNGTEEFEYKDGSLFISDGQSGWTAGGLLFIVDPGARARIDKPFRGQAKPWFTGLTRDRWSHWPIAPGGTGYLRPYSAAYDRVKWSEGVPPFCEEVTHGGGSIDFDPQSAIDEECSEPDKLYAPYYPMSVRFIQAQIEGLVQMFVDPDRGNDGDEWIRTMTQAEAFQRLGINGGISSVQDKDAEGHFHASVDARYEGFPVYWAVRRSSYVLRGSGISTVVDGQIDLGTGLFNADDEAANPRNKSDVGDEVVYSAGWDDPHYLRFRQMFDATAFMPALGEEPGSVVDPPDEEAPGTWLTRPASTNYKWPDYLGVTSYPDSGPPIVDGQLATYDGDCFDDPTTDDFVSAPSPDRPNGMSPDTTYQDGFYTGSYYKEVQEQLVNERRMVATGGTSFSFTDDTKHFYVSPLRVESGAATGGSTTTLTDSNKAGNAFWDAVTGRWVGFILRITSGDNAGQKRPITAMSGTTLTVSPAFDDPIAEDDGYEIHEPGRDLGQRIQLNRYKGRKFRITKLDGSTVETTITHNDDNTVFFDDLGFTVEPDMEGRIFEPSTGITYLRSGGQWVDPTGTDPKSGNDMAEESRRGIEPTIVMSYGKISRLSYRSATVMNQIKGMIEQCYKTIYGFEWTAYPSPEAEEPDKTYFFAGDSSDDRFGPSFSGAHGEARSAFEQTWADDFASYGPREGGGGPVIAQGTAANYFPGDENTDPGYSVLYYGGGYKNYAYATTQFGTPGNISTCTPDDHLTVTMDFFLYPTIDGNDSEQNLIGPNTYEFNTQDGMTWRRWKLFDSITAPADGRKFHTVSIGPTELSVPPSDPPLVDPAGFPPHHVTMAFKGWVALYKLCVVTWQLT